MSVDVLHVVPAFFPTRGGIEVLVENLTQLLNDQSDYTHAVVAPRINNERPDSSTLGNVRIFSIDAPDPLEFATPSDSIELLITERKLLASVLLRVRQVIEETVPRLIHIHGFSLVGYTASAVAELLGIPYIMHVHGSVEDYLSPRMQHQIHAAITVVCVSQAVKDSIASDAGRHEGVSVVRNGHLDSLLEIGTEQHEKSGNAITMVGRLEPSKGFDHALRAAVKVRDAHPDFALNIVGVGRDDAYLRQLARELEIDSFVTFHGRLEHGQTLELIATSTCIVVPSTAYEGFSLVALESAFLERPVVATNVGGLPETVVNGVTGTIVESGDDTQLAQAINHYLSNPNIAREHGRNARQRALVEFTLDRMASEINEIHVHAGNRLTP